MNDKIEVTRQFLKAARQAILASGVTLQSHLDLEFKRYLGEVPPQSLDDYRKFMMDKGIDWASEPDAHFYLHPEQEGENAVWCRLVADGPEFKSAIPSGEFSQWHTNQELEGVGLSRFVRRPGLENIYIGCTSSDNPGSRS